MIYVEVNSLLFCDTCCLLWQKYIGCHISICGDFIVCHTKWTMNQKHNITKIILIIKLINPLSSQLRLSSALALRNSRRR